MTTSDTLIGQALAGAGPGGLRRGWETSREAQRPEAGSAAATTSAALPLPMPQHSSSSHYPQSHNNLHFRLPAAVADAGLRMRGAARAPIGWGGSHVTGVEPDPSRPDLDEVGKEKRREPCGYSLTAALGRSVGLRSGPS